MATDINKIIQNVRSFYNFVDKSVISIGSGGGQLIGYAAEAKSVTAVDNSPNAVETLNQRISELGFQNKFTVICDDLMNVELSAEVVIFEFCLHEMSDPFDAILKAKSMAPDVVVCDHGPGSDWAYIVDETEKVEKAWLAIAGINCRKVEAHETYQVFPDYASLHHKVHVQGSRSIARIQKFKMLKDISIPMKYQLALI